MWGKKFRYKRRCRFLVVPLAGNHCQVVATDCTEVSDVVVAAVDVGKSLVKRNIKHLELVVVADKTLEESLIAESQAGQVVVAAVNILQIRATFNGEAGQVVVRANDIYKILAFAEGE